MTPGKISVYVFLYTFHPNQRSSGKKLETYRIKSSNVSTVYTRFESTFSV